MDKDIQGGAGLQGSPDMPGIRETGRVPVQSGMELLQAAASGE